MCNLYFHKFKIENLCLLLITALFAGVFALELNMSELQIQQARLNKIVLRHNFRPVAVLLEGRDTAGKTSTIRELTHYLPTSKYSIILSTKPSNETMHNWFDYWAKSIPESGICFFDRSWYSRATVQVVNGWCTMKQYEDFMKNVDAWERSQGVRIIKFWLSISKDRQKDRILRREKSYLTKWKLSPNDKFALSHYEQLTAFRNRVFNSTSNWHSIDYNDKHEGVLALITKLCNILSDSDKHLITIPNAPYSGSPWHRQNDVGQNAP